MNGNKAARVLNRIFQICFFLCMAVTFISVIVSGYIKGDKDIKDASGKITTVKVYYGPLAHWLIYISAILMAVLFCVLFYMSTRKYRLHSRSEKMPAEKKFRIILFSMTGVLLLLLLYVGYELTIYPRTDLLQVHTFASSFAETGNFQGTRDLIASGENVYMARYPNNFGIMFLLAMYYRVIYLIFGYVPLYAPVVLNCIALTSSMLFATLIVKNIWGRRRAVYFLILIFLFAPLYPYTPFFYTDTLSMPFGIIGIYLYVLGLKADNSQKVKKYALIFFAGAIIFLGFKVKGNLIVVIAAAVIFALLKCKWKEFGCILLALVIGFGSFALLFKAGYNAVGLVTEAQADRYEYPYTHWVMMGLKGKGGYNAKDSIFTGSQTSKAAKQEANIKEIKKRVKTLVNNHKFTEHFVVKASWMWGDGTYFIPGHIKDYVKRSYLHEVFLRDGKYYYLFFGYCNAYQLVLLFMMLMSLLKGILRPKIEFSVFLKGIVFATFVFLLVWEGRSRYLFNLTPVYIMLALDGISFTTESVRKLIQKIRKKPDLTETVSEGSVDEVIKATAAAEASEK